METDPQALLDDISDLIRAGRPDEALAAAFDVLERFGGSSDLRVRRDLVVGLPVSVRSLDDAGHSETALRLAEEFRARFASDPHPKIRAGAFTMFAAEAEARIRLGQLAEAIGTVDEALALVSTSDELSRLGGGVSLWLMKSSILGALSRFDEAIVALDSVPSAIRTATGAEVPRSTREAAVATITKLDYLCGLGRYDEVRPLGEQLSELLRDIQKTPVVAPPPVPSAASESSLAAALAGIVNDKDSWPVFEAAAGALAPDLAAQRAVELYRVSEPWAMSTAAVPEAVDAAAGMVRDIADGYALLAHTWSESELAKLPLPARADQERVQMIHEHGVAEWAAEHGSPLDGISQPLHGERSHQPPVSPQNTETVTAYASLISTMIRVLFLYELVGILSETSEGREALRHSGVRRRVIPHLRWARDWLRWSALNGQTDGPVGVLIVCLLIAQGAFVASHGAIDSADALFPPKAQLREVLRATGGYDWCVSHSLPLPAWTDDSD